MREKRKSRKRHNKRGQILTPVIFLTSLLLFAAGVGIFIYPALSNYLAQREQKEVIEEYAQTVEQIDKDSGNWQKNTTRLFSVIPFMIRLFREQDMRFPIIMKVC